MTCLLSNPEGQAAEQTLAEAQECVASNETAFSQALSEAAQAFQTELAALKGQVSLLPHLFSPQDIESKMRALRCCPIPPNATSRHIRD